MTETYRESAGLITMGKSENLWDVRREKGTSLNSDSLTPKPLASSVYVRVPEAPCPHKRSISVMSLFRLLPIS